MVLKAGFISKVIMICFIQAAPALFPLLRIACLWWGK